MPCSYSGGGYALELVLGDFHDSNGTLEASGMARACDSRLGVVGEHGRTVRVCVLVGTLDADGGCMPEAGAGDDLPALASGVHAMAHMALDANGSCDRRMLLGPVGGGSGALGSAVGAPGDPPVPIYQLGTCFHARVGGESGHDGGIRRCDGFVGGSTSGSNSLSSGFADSSLSDSSLPSGSFANTSPSDSSLLNGSSTDDLR